LCSAAVTEAGLKTGGDDPVDDQGKSHDDCAPALVRAGVAAVVEQHGVARAQRGGGVVGDRRGGGAAFPVATPP
jgi:hypothetical protein